MYNFELSAKSSTVLLIAIEAMLSSRYLRIRMGRRYQDLKALEHYLNADK
jgi:hypothetical protein